MGKEEDIVEAAGARIRTGLKQQVERYQEIDARRELDIDKIEAIWGDIKREANQAIDEMVNTLVNAKSEKELIEEKKRL